MSTTFTQTTEMIAERLNEWRLTNHHSENAGESINYSGSEAAGQECATTAEQGASPLQPAPEQEEK